MEAVVLAAVGSAEAVAGAIVTAGFATGPEVGAEQVERAVVEVTRALLIALLAAAAAETLIAVIIIIRIALMISRVRHHEKRRMKWVVVPSPKTLLLLLLRTMGSPCTYLNSVNVFLFFGFFFFCFVWRIFVRNSVFYVAFVLCFCSR